MKQKLFIFIFLVLIAAVLIGLNAASYVQKEKTPDSEASPNRSTFNSGATGTQAFFTLLAETGRNVVRWKVPPAELLTIRSRPAVFVVAGSLKRPFTDKEAIDLLEWVQGGGRLVLIDREPPESLMPVIHGWQFTSNTPINIDIHRVDPTDSKQMTGSTVAVKPSQPTILTDDINAIQPSVFAGSIVFNREVSDADEYNSEPAEEHKGEAAYSAAPVVHFTDGKRNLVVDIAYGGGRIVYLADPFIVANNGIALADNAQLALNLVSADNGVIAFDELHQGFGDDENRLLQFFDGTPAVAIFLQVFFLLGLLFFSQSRRFARPIPETERDRLSKLEYVAAMAELQSRTKAYDLAIENIYNEFRRRACRVFGLDNFTAKYTDIARLIAERTGLESRAIADNLLNCEEIIRGEPTGKAEVRRLVEALRTYEEKAGMTRGPRARI